jgi:Polyketide cyclase / dehydrase and lipid transport
LTRYIREDVHIHAPADEIFERLADLQAPPAWLPPSFRDARIEDEALAFRLALPLLDRAARLAVAERQSPTALSLRDQHSNGTHPAVEAFDWALHQESANNVHVTAEFAYEPAGGLLGPLLEMAFHAPLRRQALRDALWRLKLLAEGQVEAPAPPSANP